MNATTRSIACATTFEEPKMTDSPPPHRPRGTPPIAFLDLETTGLDASKHEILEVGLRKVDCHTLRPVAPCVSLLVRPERIEDADARALEVAGYDADAWKDAVEPRIALQAIAPLLEGAMLGGHNPAFDWGFLEAHYRKYGLRVPRMRYHRVDTVALAWPLLSAGKVRSLSLDALCEHFGLARPSPHRALADVDATIEVARRLRDQAIGNVDS